MLKGHKIYLRTIEPEDIKTLLKWENDHGNWNISETRVPFSKHLLQQYIESAQDLFSVRQIRFIICLNENDRAIGAIDLFDYEPIHQRVGVGILIDEKQRHKGYGLEAIQLVEEYALNTIGVRNLYCSILENNLNSIALFQKANFNKVGHKEQWSNNGGKWLDELIFQKRLIK